MQERLERSPGPSALLRGRSLLTMRSHTPEEVRLLLDEAAACKQRKLERSFPRRLEQRNIALIFLKPSCRTRVSFVVAAVDEGAHPEIFGPEDIRFGSKESVRDIARVFGRVFDGIMFRGYAHETVQTFAAAAGVPVWNGLSDGYHPTQVLADLLTLEESFGELRELPVAYVGDGRNNQARSLVVGAAKTGLDLRIIAPRELQMEPEVLADLAADLDATGARIRMTDDLAEGMRDVAAVYGDVWVSMGEEALMEERIALLRPYKVTAEVMALSGRDPIYLHCLPAFHDLETEVATRYPEVCEVSDEVFEGPRSRVFDQAENRMHAAKALMVLSING